MPGIDGDADLLPRLRAGNGTRGRILIVDFASPECRHEEDKRTTGDAEKEPE
jgi:hypothetical protein